MKSWTRESPFRPDILSDRVVLCTGGASGIGYEVVRQLGQHGAAVCIMGRREEFLRDAVSALQSEGIRAAYSQGDVRKPADCARAVETTVSSFGSLNVLVNSAAGMFPASLGESLTPNGFRTVIDIDLLGTYNMSSAALAALKTSGKSVVINITVPRHFAEGRNWWVGHMQAAKAAITTLSHTMAKEWAEWGIRVVNVGPGSIADTPAQLKQGNGEGVTATASTLTADGIPVDRGNPLGRMGTSFEIGMAAVFLCTAEYVNAETLVVDGGWWLGKDRPPTSRDKLLAVTRASEAKSRALKPTSKL